MLLKRPDNWLRMGFALVVFWAVLVFAEIILADVAEFNSRLSCIAVRQGYIASMRGIFLLLALTAVLAMTALLRRGFILAPVIWAAQIGRIALGGQWELMLKNLLFVSEILNLVMLALLPVLLSLLLWKSLEHLDGEIKLGRLAIPGLWIFLAVLVSAGNLFVLHWLPQFGLQVGFPGYGLILTVTGTVLLSFGAVGRPVQALVLFFAGLSLPTLVYMIVWGWYDGLELALISLVPVSGNDFLYTWLGLMAMTAMPLLLVLAIDQVFAWRQGKKIMEIY